MQLGTFLERLNEQQRRAVTSPARRLLCRAPAGSGKTSVLVGRAAWWASQRISTSNMLALTFTRLAAREMKRRLGLLIGEREAKRLWAGTFHAWCATVLQEHAELVDRSPGFSIWDDQDRADVVQALLDELQFGVDADQVIEWAWRNPPPHTPLGDAVAEYQWRMRRANAVDLQGLLELTVKLLATYPAIRDLLRARYTHVLVDEAQDNDPLQHRILELLDPEHLFIVGDPHQSIYGWRGADPEYLLRFGELHPETETVALVWNYRSAPAIIQVANRLIAHSAWPSAPMLPIEPDGPRVVAKRLPDEESEARYVAAFVADLVERGQKPQDIAILCRTNGQIYGLIAPALERVGVAYRIVSREGLIWLNPDIRRLLDLCTVVLNPRDERALLSVINFPDPRVSGLELQRARMTAMVHEIPLAEALRRDLRGRSAVMQLLDEVDQARQAWRRGGEPTASSALEWAAAALRLPQYYEAQGLKAHQAALERALAQAVVWESHQQEHGDPATVEALLVWTRMLESQDRLAEAPQDPSVKVLTVHAAKGLEWDTVIVPGMAEGIFPTRRGDPEEERRIAYVAFTRARRQLVLTWPAERRFRERVVELEPSRFLVEAGMVGVEQGVS